MHFFNSLQVTLIFAFIAVCAGYRSSLPQPLACTEICQDATSRTCQGILHNLPKALLALQPGNNNHPLFIGHNGGIRYEASVDLKNLKNLTPIITVTALSNQTNGPFAFSFDFGTAGIHTYALTEDYVECIVDLPQGGSIKSITGILLK